MDIKRKRGRPCKHGEYTQLEVALTAQAIPGYMDAERVTAFYQAFKKLPPTQRLEIDGMIQAIVCKFPRIGYWAALEILGTIAVSEYRREHHD